MCGGGSEELLDTYESIKIVSRMIQNDFVVTSIGSIELELSKMLHDHSRTAIAGKEQMIIGSIAKVLQNIPRKLCDNVGFWNSSVVKKDALNIAVEALMCYIKSLLANKTSNKSNFTYNNKSKTIVNYKSSISRNGAYMIKVFILDL